MKAIDFKTEVYDIQSNKRVVIVCLQEKIAGLDAFTLTKKFGITSKFDSTSSEYYATFLEVIICTNFKPKFVIKIIGCY